MQPVSGRSQWVTQSSTTRSRKGRCRHQVAPECASAALPPSCPLPPASLPLSFTALPQSPFPPSLSLSGMYLLNSSHMPGILLDAEDLMIKQDRHNSPCTGCMQSHGEDMCCCFVLFCCFLQLISKQIVVHILDKLSRGNTI